MFENNTAKHGFYKKSFFWRFVTTRGRLFLCAALSVFLLSTGCATVKKNFHLNMTQAEVGKVWPSPPKIARYEYLGELTGENNFIADEKDRGFGSNLLNIIAGVISGGGFTPIMLSRPHTGVVDDEGRVYVTDVGKKAVYVFDNLAGKLDVWTTATREGHSFSSPIGIAISNNGEILVVDADLAFVAVLGKDGDPIRVIGEGAFKRPTGVAVDKETGLIYVSDTHGHDIKVFDPTGALVKTIGKRGDKKGDLNFPIYITFVAGKLYVTDAMNARVQIFNRDGVQIGQFGHRGLYIGNFTRPKGIAVDGDGNIYVVESYHDHLLVFDQNGNFLLPIGGAGYGPGKFYLPAGVWTDKDNKIYVADMFNRRVAVFQYLGASSTGENR